MSAIGSILKVVPGALLVGGAIYAISRIDGQDDLRNDLAGVLRTGAKSLRWAADQADSIADGLEVHNSTEYVEHQWAKVEAARAQADD